MCFELKKIWVKEYMINQVVGMSANLLRLSRHRPTYLVGSHWRMEFANGLCFTIRIEEVIPDRSSNGLPQHLDAFARGCFDAFRLSARKKRPPNAESLRSLAVITKMRSGFLRIGLLPTFTKPTCTKPWTWLAFQELSPEVRISGWEFASKPQLKNRDFHHVHETSSDFVMLFSMSMNSSLFNLQYKMQRIIPYPAFLASWTSSTKPPVVKLQAPKKMFSHCTQIPSYLSLKVIRLHLGKVFHASSENPAIHKVKRAQKNSISEQPTTADLQPLLIHNMMCIYIYDWLYTQLCPPCGLLTL